MIGDHSEHLLVYRIGSSHRIRNIRSPLGFVGPCAQQHDSVPKPWKERMQIGDMLSRHTEHPVGSRKRLGVDRAGSVAGQVDIMRQTDPLSRFGGRSLIQAVGPHGTDRDIGAADPHATIPKDRLGRGASADVARAYEDNVHIRSSGLMRIENPQPVGIHQPAP